MSTVLAVLLVVAAFVVLVVVLSDRPETSEGVGPGASLEVRSGGGEDNGEGQGRLGPGRRRS